MTYRSALALLPLLCLGCSLGQGTGQVVSQVTCGPTSCAGGLFVHDCWGTPPAAGSTQAQGAPYDLGSSLFFAADPYQAANGSGDNQLEMRIQRGTDQEEFSDGLLVQVDDVQTIRAAIQAAGSGGLDGGVSDGGVSDGGVSDAGDADAGDAGAGSPVSSMPLVTPCTPSTSVPSATFRVALSSGIHPPGSLVEPPQWALDSIVHASLYLERSCQSVNSTLEAVDGTMTFRAMFDGDPTESNAADKFIDADFDIQVADISDAPVGAYAGDVPPGLQSRVTGCFRFYYQQGQPAQPFP